MSLSVTIDGTDYSGYVDLESLNVESNLSATMDTCTLTVAIPSKAITRPKAGQELIVEDQTGREFGGMIGTVEETQSQDPGGQGSVISQLAYEVRCRDYSFLLDRHCAVKEYAADTWNYDGIVKDLVNTYSAGDGFTTNNVQGGFQAEYTQINYQPVFQSINLLAQKISWFAFVDYYRDVHFQELATMISPLPGNTLHVDTATTQADPTFGQLGIYSDLRIGEDATQMKNRVFVRGMKVTSTQTYTQKFTGDGTTLTFGLAYEPSHTPTNIVVTVGGVTYGIQADIAGGAPANTIQDFTAYINWETLVVRFNVAPGNGVQVVVAYKPMFPMVVIVDDPSKQAVMAPRFGDDGIYEDAISDPTLNADNTGPARARGLFTVAKYGLPRIYGQFNSLLPGWRSGQYFYITSSERFDGELVNYQVFVTKVTKKLVAHPLSKQPLFQSQIEFSSSVYTF